MTNSSATGQVLGRVLALRPELEPFREMLLANAVMINEIPAPTFGESERIAFLEQRFTECGLDAVSSDEVGNGVGILQGTDGKEAIVLTAHADTPFDTAINHTCTVDAGILHGPGVADNSLGLAVLATLPTILERLEIRLRCDLLLLAATRSLEQGNQQGLRFFLGNAQRPICAGISLEGQPLGRLHYRSMASLGGRISCHVDRKVSEASAIEVMARLITRLDAIQPPEAGRTGLVLGSIHGGASYKIPARSAELNFQLYGGADDAVHSVSNRLRALIDEVAMEKGVSAHLEIIARTMAGGLESTHPLVLHIRRIMHALGIQPRKSIYSATVSGYVEHDIPAVCMGLSNGDNVNYPDEYIEIGPILTGVAQLIGMLLVIDGGCCAEHR